MIKSTKNEWTKKVYFEVESRLIFPRKFNKIEIKEIDIKPNHSVLLLQNHFSWWDGFLGSYLTYKFLKRSYHVMVQEENLKKNIPLKYKGAFSIKKNSREIFDSLDYSAKLLSDPKNMVLVFPQGKLQSMHTTEIAIEKGVFKLIEKINGNCQIIYNAVVVDYLESFKPSVTFNLIDCGTANEFDAESLNERINHFHREAIKSNNRK